MGQTIPRARRIVLGIFIGALGCLFGAAPPSTVAQQGGSLVKDCDGQTACLENLFRNADQQLNAVYRDLQRSLDTGQKSALRDAQRAWLSRRDVECGVQSRQQDFGLWVRELVQDPARTQCMIRWTEARTAELTAERDSAVRRPQSPEGMDRCTAEIASSQSDAAAVSWSIAAPSLLKVGETLQASWRAAKRFPTNAAVYLVIAIPGEARFDVDADARQQSGPGAPALPGFLALPASASAPLDIQFGRGKTRVLVPLHQPGSKLSGSFGIRTFEHGRLTIESALVLRTACGERLLTAVRSETFNLAPGAAEIVVQDPYDLETPPKAFRSNDGRYLLQVFDGRYRVYDIATGLKLLDRAGRDPNFSPTSRFIAAQIAPNANAASYSETEVIDLTSREVITRVLGPFIGWTAGDAYLIAGHHKFGNLTLDATLLSRPGARGASLSITSTGACTACASWTDVSMTIDFDRALVIFDSQYGSKIAELPSGHTECCGSVDGIQPYLAKFPLGGSPNFHGGWRAKGPILFSHAFDPEPEKGAEDQNWYRVGVKLREQLRWHLPIDPKRQWQVFGSREDWRTRGLARIEPLLQALQRQKPLSLSTFDIDMMPPLQQEDPSFSNAGFGPDGVFVKRVKQLQSKLLAEFPALKGHLSDEEYSLIPGLRKGAEPIDSGINLEKHLVGTWRWQVDGRPMQLLQLLTIQGTLRQGVGALILLDGSKQGESAIVSLSDALSGFWEGHYGGTAHETAVKPQLFANGDLVAASVSAGTMAVYDVKKGVAKAVIEDIPQRDLLQEVRLTADARHVIQVNSDGQFFLHRISDAKVAVLSGRVVDGETILYTPEGYYWSSYEGAHFVQLRFPGLPGFFSFQQFETALNRPDIVKAMLQGVRPAPPPQLAAPPDLFLRPVGNAAGGAGVEVVVQARSKVGLSRLRFYYDGRIVRDVPITGPEVQQKVSLPAAGNARRLTALAVDVKGFVSTQSMALPGKGEKRSKMHSVIVGIDRYADPNPDLTLSYAKSDAKRLGEALDEVGRRYYSDIRTTVLLDDRATSRSIASALEKAVAEAEESDTVVFSFAGHGFPGANGKYFLTPSEFNRADAEGTGLSWSRLAGILERAKARVIVILDSCHSGLSGAQGMATNDDVVQALVSGARAPMLVLAATKGRQFAEEGTDWSGGVFTYALNKVLRDGATYDLDKDGVIEVSELYRGLREIVTRETAGRQSPWLVRRDLIGDFALF